MRGTFEEPPTGLIPWFSKTKGNTYATLAASPSPLRGKPMQAQEVARRISGAVAGEAHQEQVNHTKYPSQSLSLALHYLPFASHFPLPHFTLAVLFALFSFRPLFPFAFSSLVCLCVGLLACHDGSTYLDLVIFTLKG